MSFKYGVRIKSVEHALFIYAFQENQKWISRVLEFRELIFKKLKYISNFELKEYITLFYKNKQEINIFTTKFDSFTNSSSYE